VRALQESIHASFFVAAHCLRSLPAILQEEVCAGETLPTWSDTLTKKKQAVHQHHSHIITSHASFCSSHSLSPPQPAGTKRYPGGKVPDVLGNLCLSPGWNMVRQIGPMSCHASISKRRLLILSYLQSITISKWFGLRAKSLFCLNASKLPKLPASTT
jgi:hypothetical protein